jgi:hypothetical protein
MRKLFLLIFTVLVLIILNSCKKDENKNNYFSFNGKEYTINESSLIDIILNQGEADEKIIHILIFENNKENDTTRLIFTIVDSESNLLSGNYQSFDQRNANADRGIIPFAFISYSGISFENGSIYLTGEGGSIDVSISGSNCEMKINSVSFGNYGDIIDSEPEDGDYEYSKVGEIDGAYVGTTIKETEILSIGLKNMIERIKKAIEVKKK